MTLTADGVATPTLDEKITMLEHLFPDYPPEHNSINVYKPNKDNANAKNVYFCAGEFVREVGREIESMTEDQKERLLKIRWMKCEIELMSKSESGYSSTPYYDEMIRMITQCCRKGYPEVRDQYVMTRENGQRLMFTPFTAIDVIGKNWRKPHGPSSKAIQDFRNLPWAKLTVAKWDHQIDSTRKARPVSRAAKIRLLCIFYPEKQPGWLDEIPITLHTNDVWIFKPVQWLDDIVNVWLGGKSAVALTTEEKETLEKLPWVLPWVERVRMKRLKKRKASDIGGSDTPCSTNVPSDDEEKKEEKEKEKEEEEEEGGCCDDGCEAGSSQDTVIPDALAQSDDDEPN